MAGAGAGVLRRRREVGRRATSGLGAWTLPLAECDNRSVSTPSPLSGNPLRAIFEVSAALVSSTVFRDVLAQVVAKIGEAMNVSSCDMQTYMPERDVCIYEAFWSVRGITDADRDYIGTVTNLRDRPDIRAIIESPGLFEQHLDDPDLPEQDREEIVKWGYKSTLDIPLRVGDEVVGVLGIQESRFVRHFTPAERDLFGWFCELAAVGIANAGALRRQQERAGHLQALTEISRTLAGSGDPQTVFATIGSAAAAAFDAPRAIVYEYDQKADNVTPRFIHQREYDAEYDTTGVPESVDFAIGDRSVLTATWPTVDQVSDPETDPATLENMQLWGETTCLNMPMVYRGEPLGVFMCLWTDRERILTHDELALAAGMGHQAAVALKNVQLSERLSGTLGGDPGERS
jgi:GAF domain-containing protein